MYTLGVTKAEVGYTQTTKSFAEMFANSYKLCLMTSKVGVKSWERLVGLEMLRLAPAFLAIFIISSESELTIMSSNRLEEIRFEIVIEIRGLPEIRAIFFLGIRLLPNRAGIMQ